jgi:hypothetical protein
MNVPGDLVIAAAVRWENRQFFAARLEGFSRW